jgi:hypothetical protein
MELSIRVEGDDPVSDAKSLKDFLENRNANGLNGVEMSRTVHKEGEQGLGSFIGSLLLKLAGGDEVVKGIVSLLNKWAEQHDKRIHLPNGVIIPAHTLSPEQIVEMVTKLKDQS